MNAVAEQIKRLPPLKDISLVCDPAVSLANLRQLPRENYKTIEARGFLHRKQNFAEWINTFWGLLIPRGTLSITVPLGAAAWNDPLAQREITHSTMDRFNVKGESYSEDCKPFQAVIQSVLGNDLNVGLMK